MGLEPRTKGVSPAATNASGTVRASHHRVTVRCTLARHISCDIGAFRTHARRGSFATMSDDPISRGFDVAKLLGPPALVVAYFFQADLALLSANDRTVLMLVVLLSIVALGAVFTAFERPAIRGLACGLVLLLASQTWNRVVLDHEVSERANDRRCLAIQRDMLMAHPRRSDDADLFQALSCRPQGDGSVYAPPKRAVRQVSDQKTAG